MSGPRMKPWSSDEDRRAWAAQVAERVLVAANATIVARCGGDAGLESLVRGRIAMLLSGLAFEELEKGIPDTGPERIWAEGDLWHTIVPCVEQAFEDPEARDGLVARGTVP